jgi:hypothetical protein
MEVLVQFGLQAERVGGKGYGANAKPNRPACSYTFLNLTR